MSNLHRTRRDRVNAVRTQIDAIRDDRSPTAFIRKLSGSDSTGSPVGPYSGIEWLPVNGNHENNDDENRPDFAGNFSKGLRHAALADGGLVVPEDFAALRDALKRVAQDARDEDELCDHSSVKDLDEVARPFPPTLPPVPGAIERRPFVNPLAGVAADYAGLDSFDICQPPAPRFNGELAAVEMAELYWMALLRDVPFDQWDTNADVAAAIAELDELNAAIGGTFATHRRGSDRSSWDPTIELATLFRGSAPGNDAGEYMSQFLMHDVPFGTIDMEQTQKRIPDTDYLTSAADWRAAQEGIRKASARSDVETIPGRRHIATLRDLSHYVHYDALHEAYFNAALIMARMGVNLSSTSIYEHPVDLVDLRGQAVMGKHRRESMQEGFGTFGGPAALVLVTEVATRALKTVWHQKWYVHRRLRPEASAARIHVALQPGATPEMQALAHLATLAPGGTPIEALQRTRTKNAAANPGNEETYLLPLAFPEGSPMHPSYGAGHATVAGACVTVLKALFEPRFELQETASITLNGDGTTTKQVTAGTSGMTVEGELNKLAANIAIGRNAAGVHYRTDYTKSLALGEAVAVAMLQEMAPTFVESARRAGVRAPVWVLPTFDGHWISIDCQGKIERDITPPSFGGEPTRAPSRAPATLTA